MISITVYKLNKSLIKIAKKEYALFFNDSESLTKAVLFLWGNTENIKSSLYLFKEKYSLLTENLTKNTLMSLNEFCICKTDNKLKIESVKEYGKLIIKSNAIKKYGIAFSKKLK